MDVFDFIAWGVVIISFLLPILMTINEIVHIRLLRRKVKSIEHIEQILDYSIPHIDCGGSDE